MLIPPQQDIALLLLRIVFGLILVLHGWPKLKHPSWGKSAGHSTVVGFLVGFAEVFGGLGVLFGFLTQIAAFGPLIVMLGAVYHHKFKWKHPFVSKEKSYEYALLLTLVALLFILVGPGAYSIDAMIGLA